MDAPNSYKDSFWQNLIGITERKHDLPQGLLASIVNNGERSNANQVSEAGAKTVFQITPTTRDLALKKWGIDAYLSGKNAADVAALLLKDSLKRNQGDVKEAVGEYHGGTDRANWGPRTKAYIERVGLGVPTDGEKAADGLIAEFGQWLKSNPVESAVKKQKPNPKSDMLAVEFDQWLKSKNETLADQIPKEDPNFAKPAPKPETTFADKIIGAADAGLSALTALTGGTVGMAAGSVKGIVDSVANGTYGTQAGANAAQQTATQYAEALTRTPKTETGANYLNQFGEAAGALIPFSGLTGELGAVGLMARPAASEAVQIAQTVRAMAPEAVKTAVEAAKARAPQSMQTVEQAVQAGRARVRQAVQSMRGKGLESAAAASDAPVGTQAGASMGAAAADPYVMAQGKASSASPEIQAEVARIAKKKEPINQKALDNQIIAESLDHPVYLTEGQAAEDPILISMERNARSKHPEYIERIDANNKALIENVNSLRDRVAPDVFLQNSLEHGEDLISRYVALDERLRENISGLYRDLQDANGGSFPLDAKAFVKQAESNVKAIKRARHVPAEVRGILDDHRNGQPMTFADFEEYRTILASEARKAERAGDGNVAMAISAVRDALEQMPLTNETQQIKVFADAARAAAKARFDLIKSDPAYAAILKEKATPDTFVMKYIANAPVKQIETMLKNLDDDGSAKQLISSAMIGHLRQAAHINETGGNFAQAGFNKAISKLEPKLKLVFGNEEVQRLKSIGDVARLIAQQPAGSYVNNSNTAVQAATHTIATKIPGVRQVLEVATKVREQKDVNRSLKRGAGISAKESKLLETRRKINEAKAAKVKNKQKGN